MTLCYSTSIHYGQGILYMAQYNIFRASTLLSHLVSLLENNTEGKLYTDANDVVKQLEVSE